MRNVPRFRPKSETLVLNPGPATAETLDTGWAYDWHHGQNAGSYEGYQAGSEATY